MKKLFLLFTFYFLFLNSYAVETAMVDGDGTLLVPTKKSFFEKNVRAFQQDFRIFVDTTASAQDNSLAVGNQVVPNPIYYKENNVVHHTLEANGEELIGLNNIYRYYQISWWTDCEVKVIDKWGNLIYFTSTIALRNMQVQQLHSALCDSTPKIFAWVAVYSNENRGCWGKRVEHTDFNASIGSKIGSAITAIWIYPSLDSTDERAVPVYACSRVLDTTNYPQKGNGFNASEDNLRAGYRWVVWGDYVREIFKNPDNTILVWRQTISAGETYNGNKLWRPVRLEYYGEFKEVK
ncbi:MAG: hypothetical protein J6K91_05845 [Opitutales bacterium]|nr:hypothetical protein [Opitutales bacterium]